MTRPVIMTHRLQQIVAAKSLGKGLRSVGKKFRVKRALELYGKSTGRTVGQGRVQTGSS